MSRKRREIPWLEVRGEVYYVSWYEEASRRTKSKSLGTTNPVEAQKLYAVFLSTGSGDAAASSLTVTQALDDYLREHVQQHVIDKGRQEDAASHLRAWFRSRPLRDIDIPSSRAYADARRIGVVGGGLRRQDGAGANGTIRRELAVLGAAAQHALRWRRIQPNDMPSIEMPRENTHESEWLTRDELATAIGAAPVRLRDFMLVTYYTGARRASVERLSKAQVDLPANRINLRAPTEDANQRRSVKRRPVVPIDPRLRPTVERLLMTHTDTPWLFGDTRNMYVPFRTLMEGLGLPQKANPHVLRHSRATHLLQDGVSIYDVAKLLGDTVKTVERAYGHHSPEYLAEAIQGDRA